MTNGLNHRYMVRNFVVPSSVWDPTQLPNLIAWHDASDAASITSSSGSVSQWNDKSGAGRHLTQATTANQPITGTRTINGLNTLDFDGSNDFMDAATYGGLASSTVFLVCQIDTVSLQKVFDGKTGGTGRHAFYFYGDANGWTVYQGTAEVFSNITITTATPTLAVAEFTGSTTSLARVNSTNGTSGNAGSASLSTVRVGIDSAGVVQAFDGRLAELFVASGISAAGDITSAESYLKTKWGTP